MRHDISRATDFAIESILKWTDEDAEQAHEVALALASLDWQQIILQQHQKEIDSQMWAMKNFIRWWEEGGNFCDDCEISHYVGGYHHGPQYTKVYAWPHTISPHSYLTIEDISVKRYCWKCFCKMQEKCAISVIE